MTFVPTQEQIIERSRAVLLVEKAHLRLVPSAVKTRQATLPQFSHVGSHENCLAEVTITSTVIKILVENTTTDVTFCEKPNYKLHISTGFHSHTLTPTECLLDTGAGLSIINANFVRKMWTSRIVNTSFLRFHTATKGPIQLYETILLHFQIGGLTACVWFGIVSNLAVSLLLVKSFMDCFVRGLLFSKRKVVS